MLLQETSGMQFKVLIQVCSAITGVNKSTFKFW